MIQITKKLTGKKYWRSLDQYYQTTEFQDWLNKSFRRKRDGDARRAFAPQRSEADGCFVCARRPDRLPPTGRAYSAVFAQASRIASTASRSFTTR